MDTSAEYIKMCEKSEEIQNATVFFRKHTVGTVWIPSEVELKLFLLSHVKGRAKVLIDKMCAFVADGFVRSVLAHESPVRPALGPEFLLRLYMYDVSGKRWCSDSEEWI